MKAHSRAFSLRKTCPSGSRPASQARLASTPGCAVLVRMMHARCSLARFSGVRVINSSSISVPSRIAQASPSISRIASESVRTAQPLLS